MSTYPRLHVRHRRKVLWCFLVLFFYSTRHLGSFVVPQNGFPLKGGSRNVQIGRLTVNVVGADAADGSWNPAEQAALVSNSGLEDEWGSYNMTFWENGHCDLVLTGFGRGDLVDRMCTEARDIIAGFDQDLECRCLADVRRALGSSPMAFARAVSFLRETGPRWKRATIVAPKPIAAIFDVAIRVARIEGVRFFGDRESAQAWISDS
eukprot:CAMPEP_0183556670 /NCGR_PEP_ID=MMETSP0371-20130417/83225_1 /TAXON_ID=268820 /ORGANISM="Peridinium aciculiferum, Strain PAER-2" /LENGTH=206 /DNA_ID=CAMNT_0025763329 /DNA_START=31 /DNA_END=651 /DNA_ORIENTATION=-